MELDRGREQEAYGWTRSGSIGSPRSIADILLCARARSTPCHRTLVENVVSLHICVFYCPPPPPPARGAREAAIKSRSTKTTVTLQRRACLDRNRWTPPLDSTRADQGKLTARTPRLTARTSRPSSASLSSLQPPRGGRRVPPRGPSPAPASRAPFPRSGAPSGTGSTDARKNRCW